MLAAFFMSSSLISRLLPHRPDAGIDAKADRRDHWQVYANGAAGAVGGGLGVIAPGLGLWVVTAALAAAAADTWATSVGGRSRMVTRLIWSGQKVPPGSSGGVTPLGTAGAALGALVVAAIAAMTAGTPALLPTGTLIGFFGMVVDSTLGALAQGRFHCPRCHLASEWKVHRCGTATVRESGLAWLNNDGVNFLATALAAGAGAIAWYGLAPPR